MTKFQAGDAVVYLRPRRVRGDDGWYDKIPARYVGEQTWGRGTRHKIVWQQDGEWQGRYVHALSIRRAGPTSADKP
jgi:hypothetical protein